MPIDTGVYGLLGRGVKSVADYDNEYAQGQKNKLALQLDTMKIDGERRGLEESAAMNRLWKASVGADGKVNRASLLGGAASEGLGSKIPGLQKTFLESDEAQGKVDKQKVELIDAKLKQSRAFLDTITTPEQYLQWHQGNHADSVLGPALAARGVTAETAMSSIQEALKRPGGFEELLNKSRVGIEKFTELNKPQISTQNLGGTSRIVATPGMGGAPSVLSEAPITQSPDNKASVSASLANAGATREVAAATRDAARIKGDRDTEMKLADDYRAQSKDFKAVADAYKQISATLDKATTSPAATLASATKFMKLLDPGSVVRESELGMALAATGVFDRATNYYQTLLKGKVLTPQQAADFKNITKQIYAAAQAGQKQVDANYQRQAKQYGLRPEMIVQDLGQNESDAAPAANIDALLDKYK